MANTLTDHVARPRRGDPFDLSDAGTYETWRREKLAHRPHRAQDVMVDIGDPRELTPTEREALLRHCRNANLAVYQCTAPVDKSAVRRIGEQLGLTRMDGNLCADDDSISSLQVRSGGIHAGYIPYTDRTLNWHTDGYYNPPGQQIRAFILHCVRNAPRGGVNRLLDPELAYILLRDENPDYVRALMHPQAMTIPANHGGGARRSAQTGPVFSMNQLSGSLHMRYTARTRSIQWRDDPITRDAVDLLVEILSLQTPYVIGHRLQPGQGLVCNNVLHNRSAFSNDGTERRLLYRARYYDRIQDTDTNRFLSETERALAQ